MDSHYPQPPPSAHQHHKNQNQDFFDAGHVYNEKYSHIYEVPRRPHAANRGSKGSSRSQAHDSVISNSVSPRGSSPASLNASFIGIQNHNHHSTTEILRSESPQEVISYPVRAKVDPEKANALPSHTSTRRSSNNGVRPVAQDSKYHETGPEDHPVKILLFLAGPCAFLSVLITFYTFVAIFINVLLAPLRFISSRPSFSTQLVSLLAPPLNLQLHLIYSFSDATKYSAPMLVVVHLASPVVAVGIAIAAWTAACFWFFSAILGDPAGAGGKNDGVECILAVSRRWERWLSRALR